MARDPERIDRMVEKLREVWKMAPEQRLGQLISNLRGIGPQDVFFYEDSDLENQFDIRIERKKTF